MVLKSSVVLFVGLFFCAGAVFAKSSPTYLSLRQEITKNLQKNYPSAKIVLKSVPDIGGSLEVSNRLSLQSDTGKGVAHFRFALPHENINFSVRFEAWQEALVASQRIRPREKLSESLFEKRQINVASRQEYSLRNLMLSPDTRLEKFETRQTILQGEYPLLSAIEQIPDLRRGSNVNIILKSGGLSLTTLGTVQEDAHEGESVRAMVKRTKKQIVGILKSNHTLVVDLESSLKGSM